MWHDSNGWTVNGEQHCTISLTCLPCRVVDKIQDILFQRRRTLWLLAYWPMVAVRLRVEFHCCLVVKTLQRSFNTTNIVESRRTSSNSARQCRERLQSLAWSSWCCCSWAVDPLRYAVASDTKIILRSGCPLPASKAEFVTRHSSAEIRPVRSGLVRGFATQLSSSHRP